MNIATFRSMLESDRIALNKQANEVTEHVRGLKWIDTVDNQSWYMENAAARSEVNRLYYEHLITNDIFGPHIKA